MRWFRRRTLPPELAPRFEAFLAVVEWIERAKAVLTEAVPSTRFAGRPLPDVLAEFEGGLREAAANMPAWRAPEIERSWSASRDGVEASLALAERIRLHASGPRGFEELIGLIDDLLAPLDALEGASAAFDRLRG